MGKGLAP
jgi:hypothetical protein